MLLSLLYHHKYLNIFEIYPVQRKASSVIILHAENTKAIANKYGSETNHQDNPKTISKLI